MFWLLTRARWLTRSRLLAPLLAVALGVQLWMSGRPQPPALDERRLTLADELARKLAEAMPIPPAGRPSVVVLPFERDPTGRVTEAVKRSIQRVDRYSVPTPTRFQNTLKRLGVRPEPIGPEQAAALDMEDIDGDFCLAGQVQMLSARSDCDEALLEAVLIPAGHAPGTGPAISSASHESAGSDQVLWPEGTVHLTGRAFHDRREQSAQATVNSYLRPAGLVGWLALALLLPLAAIPLVSRGLERESNAVNLGMLLGLTALTGVAAFCIIGFRLDTAWSAGLLIGATAAAFGYNWVVLSKMEELRV